MWAANHVRYDPIAKDYRRSQPVLGFRSDRDGRLVIAGRNCRGVVRSRACRNQQRSFERFNWFSEGWVARKPADAPVMGDMRYSLSSEPFDPIWGIRFTAPETVAEGEWVNRSRDRRISISDLWNEISGNDNRYQQLACAAAGNTLK